jgi:hypothetical protein
MSRIRQYAGDKRVAVALAAVAVLAVGYRLKVLRPPSPSPAVGSIEAAAPSAPPVETMAVAALGDSRTPPPPAAIPAGWSGPAWNWERNPFLPPNGPRDAATIGAAGGPPGESRAPTLRGTVAGGGGGAAIFRGDAADGRDVLVPLGGRIGGWTLAVVEPYRVCLRKGKETKVLELYRQ